MNLEACSVLRLNVTSTSNLTGIAHGSNGRWLLVRNVGTATLTIKHDTTSTAANRFDLASDTDVSIPAGGMALLEYDGTLNRWGVLVAGAGGGGGISDGATLSTGLTFPNTGLHILDTDASHDLILAPGSDLSADRTMTLVTGDGDRTITIGRDVNLDAGGTFAELNHASRHQAGADDAIKLDDLDSPDDNTDLDVSTSAHGLCPKLPNDASKYLDGEGNYTTPPSSGGGVSTVRVWMGA